MQCILLPFLLPTCQSGKLQYTSLASITVEKIGGVARTYVFLVRMRSRIINSAIIAMTFDPSIARASVPPVILRLYLLALMADSDALKVGSKVWVKDRDLYGTVR